MEPILATVRSKAERRQISVVGSIEGGLTTADFGHTTVDPLFFESFVFCTGFGVFLGLSGERGWLVVVGREGGREGRKQAKDVRYIHSTSSYK